MVSVTSRDESLPVRGLHALAPWMWRLLVAAVVLLAVYVALGRYVMSQLPAMRDPILSALNERLPFTVTADALSGGWTAFSPELDLSELVIEQASREGPPIAVRRGSVRVDVPASLSSRTLQLSRLEVRGLALDAKLTSEGTIEISGFSGGNGDAFVSWLEAFLPNVEQVTLTDNRLRLAMPSGQTAELVLDLSFNRQGNSRVLQGLIRADDVSLAVNADGVGNPLKPLSWTGDIYVDAQSSDLGSLDSLWNALDWPFGLAGQASAQFWLTRAGGDSTASMRFQSQSVQLQERDGAWDLPLDALSFDAALEQRSRHWHLLAENFHVERQDQDLDLDRVQFDWWGQSLRVRISEAGIGALPTLLASAPGLPQGLRDALPSLAPSGELRALELRLNDLVEPAESWELRAAVEELAIGSYRNSPAIAGISGFLTVTPGEGALHLDSPNFSMHFPTVYREPMRYDDALGVLRFGWDQESLRIGSGLLELQGEEGNARGLLGIDIPFNESVTGVELQLLIGLTDSDAEYRNKYLPYRLPAPLLDWLDRSVLSGDVRNAGFIWRGSVKPSNQQHMTVQLFLDAENAQLAYDPAWPVLEDVNARVWVDDRKTWAVADRATSMGAELSDIAVSVLPIPGGVRLNVEGAIAGDAASGGDLLVNSPLRKATNDVFVDWTFSGDIAGDLALELDIDGNSQPARVDVSLALSDVDATIAQVDLPLSRVNGLLKYSSGSGFAGSDFSGTAFGGQFTASDLTVDEQDDALEGTAEGTAQSTVENAADDTVAVADVTTPPIAESILSLDLSMQAGAMAIADWLDLPLLYFASGDAVFAGALRISNDAATLDISTDLIGVSLDAPRPFGKSESQPLPLQLHVPLQSDPSLTMTLGERLRVLLDMRGDSLGQLVAAVGGAEPDRSICDQRYCLSGTVSELDISAWDSFYEEYVAPASESEVTEEDEPFTYRIDSLAVGDFEIGSRSLGEARIDLWGADSLWQGALESKMVQGALSRRDDNLHLLLEYLSLDDASGGDDVFLRDLQGIVPSMRVDLLELRRNGENIGHLGFDLDMDQPDGSFYAGNITGEIFDVNLSAPSPGALRWAEVPTDVSERTEIEFDLAFDNFGEVLAASGFAPTIESESGTASLRLSWPGSPTAFATAKSKGAVTLLAENGRLLESRPGALALISFLNLAEILRGLSMTHMFESGIPFLSAKSEIHLHEGMLEVVDLQIDGAASAFAFNGLSDLQEGSIDGELVVTLPVANNLPWVAALAAGLPVAAGVFVVSKVFEKQVNRMSSAVYGVTGDIEEPAVQFRRLFDDQLTPTTVVPADSGTGDD